MLDKRTSLYYNTSIKHNEAIMNAIYNTNNNFSFFFSFTAFTGGRVDLLC